MCGTAIPQVNSGSSNGTTVTASETPFTLKLPNLWHLASDVEGLLVDGSSSLDLLSSLHPTAAVAGTPTAGEQSTLCPHTLNRRI